MLEILKRLQSEFALMREDLRGVRAEMVGPRHHMAAFLEQEASQDIASIKLRLDRIERRLDLVE